MTTETTDLEAFVTAFDDLIRAAKRARARAAGDGDLSPAQYALLAPLVHATRRPGLRELAQAAGVAPPTATRMLDALERRGAVTRERCSDDRRAVRLALTPEGEELVRAARERALALRRAIFERLDDDERRAAARVLSRLAQALGEATER